MAAAWALRIVSLNHEAKGRNKVMVECQPKELPPK